MASDFSQQIKRARIAIGWTQQQVANAVGVSKSAVAQWEGGGGGNGVSSANLIRLSRVLRVDLAALMLPTADPTPEGIFVTDRDEMALIELYRQVSRRQRELLLQLIYTTAGATLATEPEIAMPWPASTPS